MRLISRPGTRSRLGRRTQGSSGGRKERERDRLEGSTSWQDGRMAPRLAPLLDEPIGFAHRGARAHAPENTIEAFELALRLGATGIESDVWLSADGQAVLDHDGVVGGRLRRKAIRDLQRVELPPHIPSLRDLYASCGTGFDLSLDVKDDTAAAETIASARDHGAEAEARLWLCHPDADVLVGFRPLSPHVKLVHSTRLRDLGMLPEQHAARMQALGIDAVNLHHTDWSGGLVTLYHRFEVLAFGWDAQHERVLHDLLDSGVDAVYSDFADRMTSAIHEVYGA
jgi:glycerophosphoryl diester phosphodiesterase